jgi:hypothetical protein
LSFQTFAAPLLYFVTYGAVLALFCSAIAVCVIALVKLRWLLIRWLGGVPKEQPASSHGLRVPQREAINRNR